MLTNDQTRAIRGARNVLKNGGIYRIAGYAGTGKSTIVKEILDGNSNVAVCAYTGKAASVLNAKGTQASTIHSRIYRWSEKKEKFFKLPSTTHSGFVIDEGSMVGVQAFKDLMSFRKPIVIIGDPFQLEPVGDEHANLLTNPNVMLTEVFRQSLDSPIVELATRVRLGERFNQEVDVPGLRVTRSPIEEPEWADIVISGFNNTRVSLNNRIRSNYSFSSLIAAGDTLVCLSSDRKFGIANGQTMFVLDVLSHKPAKFGGEWAIKVRVDDGIERTIVVTDVAIGKAKGLSKELRNQYKGSALVVDYGYCLTAHKSQGSQWNSVAVVSEQCQFWDERRWLYTAMTRAADDLRVYL
jgi:exodeoxyribonuclease V